MDVTALDCLRSKRGAEPRGGEVRRRILLQPWSSASLGRLWLGLSSPVTHQPPFAKTARRVREAELMLLALRDVSSKEMHFGRRMSSGHGLQSQRFRINQLQSRALKNSFCTGSMRERGRLPLKPPSNLEPRGVGEYHLCPIEVDLIRLRLERGLTIEGPLVIRAFLAVETTAYSLIPFLLFSGWRSHVPSSGIPRIHPDYLSAHFAANSALFPSSMRASSSKQPISTLVNESPAWAPAKASLKVPMVPGRRGKRGRVHSRSIVHGSDGMTINGGTYGNRDASTAINYNLLVININSSPSLTVSASHALLIVGLFCYPGTTGLWGEEHLSAERAAFPRTVPKSTLRRPFALK
ncbi:hypothetical protein BKA70DRAFT_1404020 [Coprinopsis sp. MPI-PUGE-AT-0042]|nr:hypothetical protein BKA70DRAFT_1404020 [Coprinopsis sp. MPI-PUGE-AT-0042]